MTTMVCPGRRTVGAALLAAVLLAAPLAQAGDLGLLINGKAIHINAPATANYNERNWGGGLHYDFDPVKRHWVPFVTASGFRDSYKRPSYYAGGGMVRRYTIAPSLDDLRVDLGVVAFFMTREDYKDNDPFFGILPVLSLGTDKLALNVTYVPKVHPKMTALVFFQLKLKLMEF